MLIGSWQTKKNQTTEKELLDKKMTGFISVSPVKFLFVEKKKCSE